MILERFSEDLQRILGLSGGNPLKIGKIIQILGTRGFNLLLILLALPFCIPIPLPGLSTPFGLIIFFLGFQITLRKKLRLPERLSDYELPYSTLSKAIKAAFTIFRPLEKILYPRLLFLNRRRAFIISSGLVVMSNAFLLLLPIPIPLTNTFPAISIVLLGFGTIEHDGIFILLGYLAAGVAWAYLFILFFAGNTGLKLLGF